MATETTVTSAKAWSPDITAYAASDVIPDALVLQCSTVLGHIEGDEPLLRVAYVDDAAADFVAEGNAIPEACLLYTSPSPRDLSTSRMPSSA